MLLPNRNGSAGDDYRFGFQGQEKDDELKGANNSVNFEYRMHDPRIGRFFAIDPLIGEYPHYTPYSFSGNKVIHCRELEGLEEFIAIVTPSVTDPKLVHTHVIKISDTGPLKVTYVHRNNKGVVTNTETPLSDFKSGTAEHYAMHRVWKNTGKTEIEMMAVSTYAINPDGTISIAQDKSSPPKSALAAQATFQYDLTVLFKPNKAEITKEELQNGTYLKAKDEIDKFQQTIGCDIEIIPVNKSANNQKFNFSQWQMIVNGETDSQPSSPPFPSVNGLPEGNPSLGQKRADNLLHELSPSHPTNNSTNVINHTGTVKSADRNASIFFIP